MTKELIFIALNTYPGIALTGVTKYSIKKFKDHFDKIHVFCPNKQSKNQTIKKNNVIFYAGSFLHWKKSIKTINSKNISFVYITDWFVGGLLGAKFAKKHHIPLVMRCGSPWDYTLNSPSKVIKSVIKNITKRYVLKNVKKIAYNSHAIIDHSIQHEHKVIRNPIDTTLFKAANEQEKNHEKQLINLKKEALKILFIGRICEEKGISYLSKAFEELKKDNISLTIIGSGKMPKNLQKNKQVTNIGRINHENLTKYIQQHDCLILPSLSQSAESSPNVILEAMACEKPIIATKINGIPEIIKNKENGFLIQEKNHKEIITAIKKLEDMKKKDPQTLEKIGKRNREKIIQLYQKGTQIQELYSYLFLKN